MLEKECRDEIIRILKNIGEACVNGEPEKVADYFHDDMTIVFPGFTGKAKGKQSCVQGYVDFVNSADIHKMDVQEPEIDLWGDAAVASCEYDTEWKMNGQEHREKGRNIFVFIRQNGEWKAVWRTLIPQPK